MTDHDAPGDRADDGGADGGGATTSGKGTPLPVEGFGDHRAKGTIALLLAGPVIWSVHFMLIYLVVEAGCTGDGPGLTAFAPPVPTLVTLAATVVAAVACAGSGVWGYRRWRARREEAAGRGGDDLPGDGGSLEFAGLLLSALGFITVLFVGLPALFLPACVP